MRTAKGSLAAPRVFFGSQKLFAKSFWSISRSPASMGENEESAASSDVAPGSRASKYSKLLALMDAGAADEQQNPGLSHQELAQDFSNAPIFTAAVDKFVHSALPPGEQTSELVPQYGLIGSRVGLGGTTASREDGLVIGNVNVPWSAFICGSQGAGKSHTLCCLLENALVTNNDAGARPPPLAGMVMHYDSYSSHNTTQVCEAAYLCSSCTPVTVLVSPSNIWAMKRFWISRES
ncbi:hypothetical protein DL762_008766 [Monosporascus cannonballus]|uniref:Uncharacterized protein n=1 Tax=Monosporascus cannonballus TaxID=155416 RepID=A0ABY0GVR4_9PEZI|nr:hypothetical protein DL762_008766 [Monosporascus cannonballus]